MKAKLRHCGMGLRVLLDLVFKRTERERFEFVVDDSMARCVRVEQLESSFQSAFL